MLFPALFIISVTTVVNGNVLLSDLQPGLIESPGAEAEPRLVLREAHRHHLRPQNQRSSRAANCDPKWAGLTPDGDHTMCKQDVGTAIPLSQGEKENVTLIHNILRSQVNPPASNMPKVIWDEGLAEVAAKWARQCVVGHDPENHRYMPSLPGVYIGQNGAFGTNNLLGSTVAWYNEVHDFEHGTGSINGKQVGHYTAVVQAKTQRIGCGSALCPNSKYKRHHFCNYARGQGGVAFPYKIGESCAECPNHCDKQSQRLCDCGGKICFNFGKLNLKTCNCDCNKYLRYTGPTCSDKICGGKLCRNLGKLNEDTCQCECSPLWTGPTCQTKVCPAEDKWFCAEWPDRYCTYYLNVKDKCPYKCGECPIGL